MTNNHNQLLQSNEKTATVAMLWRRIIGCRRTGITQSHMLKIALVLLLVIAWKLVIERIVTGNLTVITNLKLDGADRLVGLSIENVPKCEIPSLNPSISVPWDVSCQRMAPLPDSCRIARELFESESPEKCKSGEPYSICQLKPTTDENHEVLCNPKECLSGYLLGIIDYNIGVLKWNKYKTSLDLQRSITKLLNSASIKATGDEQHDFCFIKCLPPGKEDNGTKEGREFSEMYGEIGNDYLYLPETTQPEQLLILPLQIPKKRKRRQGLNISFNLYLLDSVSHSHFFRSLPKSVKKLRHIKQSGTASVFSFNLMQSLKGRTYENLQALFSGEIYDPVNPFGVQEIPPKAVQTLTLLKDLKQAGYRTSWTEDTCWTWEWGIAKNMVVHSPNEALDVRWTKLRDVLAKSGIDGLHFSLASCEILKANGIRDIFHGPPAICYNRRHHHQYTFEYLKARQSKLNKAHVPFFDFTITAIAHDDTGRRVQSLDDDLVDYLEFLSVQDNMISVILADHGNAYGEFMQHSLEARVEMFHPSFLIVVSANVARELGQAKMNALSTNQNRLVSILDLHYTLRTLSSTEGSIALNPDHYKYDLTPSGLLVPVSRNRTCDSIPRINPNICICSAYEKAVENDTMHAELADAALSKFNEVILDMAPKAGKEYGACKPLQLKWFGGVRESHPKADVTVIKMDLHLASTPNSGNTEEVIFVIMQSTRSHNSLLQITSFERLTSYVQFEKCKDSGVPIKLCVCNLPPG